MGKRAGRHTLALVIALLAQQPARFETYAVSASTTRTMTDSHSPHALLAKKAHSRIPWTLIPTCHPPPIGGGI
jgi:hypothetical protein